LTGFLRNSNRLRARRPEGLGWGSPSASISPQLTWAYLGGVAAGERGQIYFYRAKNLAADEDGQVSIKDKA